MAMWFFNADQWNNYLLFVKSLSDTLGGTKVMLWQIPQGHVNGSATLPDRDLTDTDANFEDSATSYFFGDAFTAERILFLAIYKNGRRGLLTRTGQADTDIRVFAFAGAINDAAHDGKVQVFNTNELFTPNWHLITDIALDFFSQFLEHRRCRPPASGAGRHQGHETPQPHGLQNFLGNDNLLGPIAAGFGGQGDPDRIANTLLQEDRQGRR